MYQRFNMKHSYCRNMYYNSLKYIEIDLVALLNINKNFTALINNNTDNDIYCMDLQGFYLRCDFLDLLSKGRVQ